MVNNVGLCDLNLVVAPQADHVSHVFGCCLTDMQSQCGLVIRERVLPKNNVSVPCFLLLEGCSGSTPSVNYSAHTSCGMCRNMVLVWHFQCAYLCLNFMFQFPCSYIMNM